MLNNWDDPFAQFSNNKNVANATADIGNTVNDVIKAEAIEAEEAAIRTEATERTIPEVSHKALVNKASATATTITAKQTVAKAPHAGDGIVSNEQLMATAGAAPQVNPIIEDIPKSADARDRPHRYRSGRDRDGRFTHSGRR